MHSQPAIFLENKGKKPILNLTLQLEYPNEFQIPGYAELKEVLGSKTAPNEKSLSKRTNMSMGSYTQTRWEIGTLRPGENLGVYEPILYSTRALIRKTENLKNYEGASKSCREKTEQFLALCPVRAFLFSDNLQSEMCKFTAFFLEATSVEKRVEHFESVIKALWDGSYPKQGIHITCPWKKLIPKELASMQSPTFRRLDDGFNIDISPHELEPIIVEIHVPPSQRFGDLHDF